MGVQIRRIVTGHDASEKAIVKTDEQVTAVPRIAAGISGCASTSTRCTTARESSSISPTRIRTEFYKRLGFDDLLTPRINT
jgi:hypothetical protein